MQFQNRCNLSVKAILGQTNLKDFEIANFVNINNINPFY